MFIDNERGLGTEIRGASTHDDTEEFEKLSSPVPKKVATTGSAIGEDDDRAVVVLDSHTTVKVDIRTHDDGVE